MGLLRNVAVRPFFGDEVREQIVKVTNEARSRENLPLCVYAGAAVPFVRLTSTKKDRWGEGGDYEDRRWEKLKQQQTRKSGTTKTDKTVYSLASGCRSRRIGLWSLVYSSVCDAADKLSNLPDGLLGKGCFFSPLSCRGPPIALGREERHSVAFIVVFFFFLFLRDCNFRKKKQCEICAKRQKTAAGRKKKYGGGGGKENESIPLCLVRDIGALPDRVPLG